MENGCWNKISSTYVTFLWFLLWQKRLAMTFNFQDIKKISKEKETDKIHLARNRIYK